MADKFDKLSVKPEVKREIDIIAAAERRHVYEVVADALKVYKIVSYGKGKKSKNAEPVTVAEVVAH